MDKRGNRELIDKSANALINEVQNGFGTVERRQDIQSASETFAGEGQHSKLWLKPFRSREKKWRRDCPPRTCGDHGHKRLVIATFEPSGHGDSGPAKLGFDLPGNEQIA